MTRTGRGAGMKRRRALGLLATGLGVAAAGAGEAEGAENRPPRITSEELARRVRQADFRPESLYATEVEFRAKVERNGPVPYLQIQGMEGLFSRVHLHGAGDGAIPGKELVILGLIVDHGYGALMVWKREWKYTNP